MLRSYLKNPKTSDVMHYTKISENKATLFFYRRKHLTQNSGRFMLNQSKEVFCICVWCQESRDSIKKEPEPNVYEVYLKAVYVLM